MNPTIDKRVGALFGSDVAGLERTLAENPSVDEVEDDYEDDDDDSVEELNFDNAGSW